MPFLHSRPATTSRSTVDTPHHVIPTIRVINATPGSSFDAAAPQEPLSTIVPKRATDVRRKLVPKKSKLGMLTSASPSTTTVSIPNVTSPSYAPGTPNGTVSRSSAYTAGRDSEHIGGSPIRQGEFDIYVDPTIDPDLGEIVMVKKKKSRLALDGLSWGTGVTLGEVTNVPNARSDTPTLLKLKSEDKDKWWSIGRGRKDSKEKDKKEKENKSRPKSPEGSLRSRFNSLDSMVLLNSTAPLPKIIEPECAPHTRAGTPTAGGLLAATNTGPTTGSIALRAMRSVRSIALFRSTETVPPSEPSNETSKAKEEFVEKKKSKKEKKDVTVEEKSTKKKTKKASKKEKEKDLPAPPPLRNSSSSFEAGALSTASPAQARAKTLTRSKHSTILGLALPKRSSSPEPAAASATTTTVPQKKKSLVRGLGLPSTVRVQNPRMGSTASSVVPSRLSVEGIAAKLRSGSTVSTGSSLRPLSTSSGASRESSASSNVSVRWDEDHLETVKERRKAERREREKEGEDGDVNMEERRRRSKEGGTQTSTNRHSAEGRRRTALSEVFPEAKAQVLERYEARYNSKPELRIESATEDGHGELRGESDSDGEARNEDECGLVKDCTPLKKVRARPMSEQLLGKGRPKGMCNDGEGVISILDAATNDLEKLIGHLDLEATPGSRDGTPYHLRPSPLGMARSASDSPTKSRTGNVHANSPLRMLRASMASLSSLRPYNSVKKSSSPPKKKPSVSDTIGQQIASWQTLNQSIVPSASPPSRPKTAGTQPKLGDGAEPVASLASAFQMSARPGHRRTMTPSMAVEAPVVFQPLRPAAKSNRTVSGSSTHNNNAVPSAASATPAKSSTSSLGPVPRAPASLTFGSRSSTRLRLSTSGSLSGSPSPVKVFRRARLPLGLSGSFGGSVSSRGSKLSVERDLDGDEDIPSELQVILAGQSESEGEGSVREGVQVEEGEDATMSFPVLNPRPSSIGLPPSMPPPLPTLASFGGEPPKLELPPAFKFSTSPPSPASSSSDTGDDTKKSFDFTGEIQKLNQSGGSDRRSFVEQLENAFRTPAKVDVDLGYGFGLGKGFLSVELEVPPVPEMPVGFGGLVKAEARNGDARAVGEDDDMAVDDEDEANNYSGTRLIDVREPTLLPGSDSLAEDSEEHFLLDDDVPILNKSTNSSVGSRPSDGQLNKSFKFGGRPQAPVLPAADEDRAEEKKPTNLSDIIPPPSHQRSLSMDDGEDVLNSIYAKATELPASFERVRVLSDVSYRPDLTRASMGHSRPASGVSFQGFDSFSEVRRGFEFGADRPTFYPPPGAAPRHNRYESVFSIASVSSYGMVINPGMKDPFDYGSLASVHERPRSEDVSSMSMSMSVDDTFSFIHRGRAAAQTAARRRVDSDASSFYFRSSMLPSYGRGHRHRDSTMSISSQGPPVSLYNRSFGVHRRNDSAASVGSVAQSYAMYGAAGGRAIWARHRQEASVDSVMSDFSMVRLGRPGIGDKMFENSGPGAPLPAISASPADSEKSHHYSPQENGHPGDQTCYDSIMDSAFVDIAANAREGQRSSSSVELTEDSIFDKTGCPTSVSSEFVFGSDEQHDRSQLLLPPHQFRPLSILSNQSIHSPMKEDDTMISMLGGGHVRRRSVSSVVDGSPCVRVEKRKHCTFRDLKNLGNDFQDSPNKARIVEKPSIASTASSKFGDERMIRAQRGLFERRSLEDSCLVGDGEDLTNSIAVPVFSRPAVANRSRSSTCTSLSSGQDTPPLSSSDGASYSESSQSSIDVARLDRLLANATHPSSVFGLARSRTRARGQGHRRRISQARASRTSVYETIEEELSSASDEPSPARTASVKKGSPTVRAPVYIVDSETSSINSDSYWDDEQGISALRKYYALRDEATDTVSESKRLWIDTAFSAFALQSFQPPQQPAGMQALLEHSQMNYGPLPSELRPRRVRSRTQSRTSPYPQARTIRVAVSPEPSRVDFLERNKSTTALREVHVNPNVQPVSEFNSLKSFVLQCEPKRENAFGLAPNARPRVASGARRSALGWTKRSAGAKASTEGKENMSQGMLTTTPGLRISRPRPRGRQTPGSTKTIRV